MNQRKFRPWGKKGATKAPKKELASRKLGAMVLVFQIVTK